MIYQHSAFSHTYAFMCAVRILHEIKREAQNNVISSFNHPLPKRTFQKNTIHTGHKKLQSLSHSQALLGAQKVWYGLAASRKSCLQHFSCIGVSVHGCIQLMTLPSPQVATGKTPLKKFVYVLTVYRRSLAVICCY